MPWDGSKLLARSACFSSRFEVTYEYPVYFTRDVFSESNPVLAEAIARLGFGTPSKIAVFVDDGVVREMPDLTRRIAGYAQSNGSNVELAGAVMIVKGGEDAKNDPAVVAALQSKLVAMGLDRHSYVVAVGGGAVLDVVGYVAAMTHRGIRHIRIPTTVLAQNDFWRRREERRQCLRHQEPVRHLRAARCGHQRLGLHRCVAGTRQARRHGGSRQGRADPRSRFLRLAGGEGRGARDLHLGASRPADPPLRRPAYAPDSLTAAILSSAAACGRSISGIGLRISSKPCRITNCAMAKRWRSGLPSTRAIRCLPDFWLKVEDARVRALLERLGFQLWHAACDARGPDGRLLLLEGLEEFREHLGGELTITLLREVGVGVEVHTMRCRPHRPGSGVASAARQLMQLALPGHPHLTYCTNIHAGETWAEIEASLAKHLPEVKRLVSPEAPMGVGLRLSGYCGRRACRPGAPRSAYRLSWPPRALRLHHQRLPLRPLSWTQGEGAGLRARLARARASFLHQPLCRHPRRTPS